MLIETFNIRVGLTEKLELQGLRPCTEIYKVGGLQLRSEVYVLDSPEVRSVACHPHIVGDELIESMGMVAYDAVKALMELTSMSELEGDEIVFEHVLRAAPGYCLHEALKRAGRRIIEYVEGEIKTNY